MNGKAIPIPIDQLSGQPTFIPPGIERNVIQKPSWGTESSIEQLAAVINMMRNNPQGPSPEDLDYLKSKLQSPEIQGLDEQQKYFMTRPSKGLGDL